MEVSMFYISTWRAVLLEVEAKDEHPNTSLRFGSTTPPPYGQRMRWTWSAVVHRRICQVQRWSLGRQTRVKERFCQLPGQVQLQLLPNSVDPDGRGMLGMPTKKDHK